VEQEAVIRVWRTGLGLALMILASACSDLIPPSGPVGGSPEPLRVRSFRTTHLTHDSVALAWQPFGARVEAISVWRGEGPSLPATPLPDSDGRLIARLPGDAVSFIDRGVRSGTQYAYQLQVFAPGSSTVASAISEQLLLLTPDHGRDCAGSSRGR
jgi:hypothetical protein